MHGVAGEILDAFAVPLRELVKARIDGAHRAELARLTTAAAISGIFGHYMNRARDIATRTGAITVIVSHRFSTVSGADLILVMESGRLVQHGTHEELLVAGGPYAELHSLTSGAYRR